MDSRSLLEILDILYSDFKWRWRIIFKCGRGTRRGPQSHPSHLVSVTILYLSVLYKSNYELTILYWSVLYKVEL